MTEVETIPGIGEKTANKLLVEFRSWKKIKEASLEELTQLVGKSKAQLIIDQKKREP
ncbi:MAG: helix-hairpin-helix domain-containing protein [Cyclobacteriaceae bacterium]